MKTNLKDYLFSILVISLIFLLSLYFISLTKPFTSPIFHEFFPLIHIILFLFLYGFMTVSYLKILNWIIPIKEGIYDMNHSQYTLWKHHAVVGELGKLALSFFFPVFLRPIFYALMGAKIGKNVAIGGVITDPMLTKIEDYSVLGQDSIVTAHTMIFNKFILKSVVIGKGTTVGINAVIMPGVEVAKNSIVAPSAVVLMDTKIASNEFWGGIPAKKIKDIEPN